MSDDNIENLPSINDFLEESKELPSIDDFIEKEKKEEIVEDTIIETTEEPAKEVQAADLTEVLRLISDVRRDIPNIPEIKSYDEPLQKLSEQLELVKESIPEVPEPKSYDREVEAISEQIDFVKQHIANLPEVKYYDEQISDLEDRIDILKENIPEVPEPKSYDSEIASISEEIEKVRSEIPNLPQWVNEDSLPDLSWVGRTFSVIDEDVTKVNDALHTVKDRLKCEVEQLTETISTKEFETGVEIEGVRENIKETKEEIRKNVENITNNIYDELKEAALQINSHHREFKDDDNKLKKYILGKYEVLRQNINEQVNDFNTKNIESQNIITKSLKEYFDQLQKEIAELPEVKYYDDSIQSLKGDISQLKEKREEQGLNITELYKIVEEIRGTQEELQEIYNDRPLTPDPDLKQGDDPLTPTGQKFATLQDLAANYRLFVNRVEQQLYTIGGGGAGYVKDLDDVDISGLQNDYILVWDSSVSMWKTEENVSGAAGTWASSSTGIHTTRNVGIGTDANSSYQLYVSTGSTSDTVAYFDGHISVGGSVYSREVVDIESVGIITGLSDLDIRGNSKILGITTIGSSTGVGTVHIGVGETALLVQGDTRITGILTIGQSSITIDGTNNTINIGEEDVTITNSAITIGDNVTIDASATGINSAPNVLYVAKDGADDSNGTSVDNAFLTIKAAVGAASSGTTVKVLSGTYLEANPISVGHNISIVGDDQRSVKVLAGVAGSDIFHVRKGVKLANMTFSGHVSPAAAVAFPTNEIAENVGGGKWKGPYIQNCTSDTTTGTGCYIDGDQARSLKAMNIDAFTQYNQGGVGVAVTNGGFAQLVSLFTICNNEAVTCDKGGQADIANSNCSFGTYGLVARGVSDLQYTGVVTTSAAVSQKEVVVNVNSYNPEKTINNFVYDYTSGIATVTTTAAHGFQVGMGVTMAGIGLTCDFGSKTYPYRPPYIFTVDSIPSTTSFVVNVGISTLEHHYAGAGSTAGTVSIDVDRPYDGQLVYFDTLYKQVQTITVTNGGSGYTSTPTVTIEAPAGPSGETATAYATLDGTVVDTVTIISSGSQYTETPDVTFSGGGGSSAAATASMEDLYYTINSSTPVSSGISTLTLDTNLLNTVGVGSTAFFNQGSRIVASSHTFEYVGAGNQITNATPKRGGVTIQANEVVTSGGGKVLYTSTDQAGNFRIGDDLQINQNTGTISGRSFSKSLFNEMTPFILALS